MKVLVTGATGMIGANVAAQLARRGDSVRAVVRNVERAREILGAGYEFVPGDVTDEASLLAAMQGVEVVYHCAGLPEQWLPDPDTFRVVNVEGTRHAVEAALQAGVRRFVYTSTIDVFRAERGAAYDESQIDPEPKGTYYERSKQEADQVVVSAVEQGLDAVFLHPAGLYGPGPAGSPGMNQFIVDLIRGRVPMLLPGGLPLVYSEDCARGHIAAADRAPAGERFILSGEFHTLEELSRLIAEVAPVPKIPRTMPLWFARAFAAGGEAVASVTGSPPLLPKGQLHFLQWNARPRSDRARRELGWQPLSTTDGLERTVAFLRTAGRIPG